MHKRQAPFNSRRVASTLPSVKPSDSAVMTQSEPPGLREVIGRNAKRIRHAKGLTLDQVAQAARSSGVRWTGTTVADIEGGRRAPSLEATLVLAGSLGVDGAPIRLAELFAGADDERFSVLASATLPLSDARRAAEGEPVELHPISPARAQEINVSLRTWARKVSRASDDARVELEDLTLAGVARWEAAVTFEDERAARKLGVEPMAVSAASRGLWGRDLATERDARAGMNSSAQARGHVTRALLAELRKHLDEDAHDGND